jgi:indolepyruvate ferredoxin oxidoreductase alpha subunit
MIAEAVLNKKTFVYDIPEKIPGRPPVLCPGCPHRAVFSVLRDMKITVMGDIGCYTLGALPPLNSVDTTFCMGASVGMAHGMEHTAGNNKKTVAVIGDSTFIHSGITGLIDVVYNKGSSVVMILDNSITGMTGHQDHPGTGKTIKGEPAPALNLEKLCEAVGVKRVSVIDPHDLKGLRALIKNELEADEPSVIITRRPCRLLVKDGGVRCFIDNEKCKNCGTCLRLGCPAIQKKDGQTRITAETCVGCGLCESVCAFGAIITEGRR